MGDVREQLQNLTQNFCLICEDLKNVDKQKINIALDELNALNFKNFVISDSNIVLALLKTICGVIPTSESFLVSKSCKLLCRLLKNYQLPPLRCVATCKYLMKALEDCNKSVWEDILAALYVILKTNGAYVSELYDSLLGDYGVLFNLLQSNESKGAQVLNIENPFYVELGALKCIQALILHCTNSTPTSGKYLTLQHLNKCTEVAIFYLYRIKYKKQDEIIFCEILICAFNILMQIFSSNTEVDRCLGETIGACRCWMMYALKDCSSLTVAPHKVMPSQLDVSEMPQTQANKGGKKIKLRKPRNSKPVSNWKDESSKDNTHLDESVDMENNPGVYKSANAMITQLENIATPQFTIMSESDMSDWESNKHKKLLSVQIKTRLAALNLLTILVRSSEKHIIFGYWWCLLPSDDIAKSCGLTLFLQHETNTGGKTAALTAMLNIITACRSYLSIAEISKRSVTSFTPLSVSLGQTLIELHHLLSKIISNERRVPVLIAALKSMVACIQATPYHKLETTILIPMVESAKKVLSGDWTVQVAALIVMGCVISLEPPAVDIMNVFLKNPEPFDVTKSTSPGNNDSSKETYLEEDSDEYIEDILEEDAASQNLEQNVILYSHDEILEVSQETLDKMSWLVEICLRNLGWTFKNGVMEQSRLSLATVRQESLQVLSAIALKSFELLLAPHFMIISRMFHTALRDPLPDMLLHATKCLNSVGDALQKLGESSVLKQEDCVMFWTMMLRGPLTELLQSDKVAPARATACDCIGSIGENIYNKLPQQLKILCATLLLGSSGDEDALVRSAAVRALSVCIMYKDWREDPCIVSDCGESVLRVLCDATLAVKIKATWALANITDALLLNLEDKSVEQVDNYLLMRLLQESITTSKDNDKIKMNSMRSIGNIMLLLGENVLKANSQLQGLTLDGIERLVYCASNGNNMKVRWNACHALGKTLKNDVLFRVFKKWQTPVFTCLCDLMEKCRNLKVRAHAAIALRSPTSRQLYDNHFASIWRTILVSMENTIHTEDFTEYKHKDHLVEQLCVTLSHMACLMVSEDLSDILDVTSFLWTSASQLLRQVAQTIEPEGESCCKMLDAAKYVTTQLTPCTEGQRECLNIIQNLFIWET